MYTKIIPFLHGKLLQLIGRYSGDTPTYHFASMILTGIIRDYFFWKFVVILIIYYQLQDHPIVVFLGINTAIICYFISISSWTYYLLQIFTIGYLRFKQDFIRFMGNYNLFMGFMVNYISALNLLLIFICWEGLGLISGLLISHWFNQPNSLKSSLKALFVNRIGDFGLTIVILDQISNYFTVNLYSNFNLTDSLQILLLIAVISKSAQVILHFWLPDAMAAPTPVSSLLHAATMVTAGLFLFIKLGLTNTFVINICLIILSFISLFYAGFSAGYIFDFKRIIAFSTCSQLAIISIAFCTNVLDSGLFHLFSHVFFKAALFLTAGTFIHIYNDNQDLRLYGNISYVLPGILICFIICAFGLSSTPFTSAFFSKDNILDNLLIDLPIIQYISWFFIINSIILTVFYSFFPVKYISDNNSNFTNLLIFNTYEKDYFIIAPIFILTFTSILFSYIITTYFSSDNYFNFILQYIPVILSIFIFIVYEFYQILCVFQFCDIFNLKYLFDLSARISLKYFSIISYIYTFKLFDKGFYLSYFSNYIQSSFYSISQYFIYRNYNTTLYVFGLFLLQFVNLLIVYFIGYGFPQF